MLQIKHLADKFKCTFSLYNSVIHCRIDIKKVALKVEEGICSFFSHIFSVVTTNKATYIKTFLFYTYIIISFMVFCLKNTTHTHTQLYMKHTSIKKLFRKTRDQKVLLKSVLSEGKHECEFSSGRVRLLRSKHQTVKEVRMCKVRSQFHCLQKPSAPTDKKLFPLKMTVVSFQIIQRLVFSS